jgi:uncharacterized protein YoxC
LELGIVQATHNPLRTFAESLEKVNQQHSVQLEQTELLLAAQTKKLVEDLQATMAMRVEVDEVGALSMFVGFRRKVPKQKGQG